MADMTEAQLREKLVQAGVVMAYLMDKTAYGGPEAHRARDYFAGETFDGAFLPWPRDGEEGLRPEDLNAANDG